MDHKITINNKEYDKRDFTDDQQRLLNLVLIANTDITKADARLQVMSAGRDAAVNALTASLESAETPTAGETNNG